MPKLISRHAGLPKFIALCPACRMIREPPKTHSFNGVRMRQIICAVFGISMLGLGGASLAQTSATTSNEKRSYHVSQTFHVGGEGGWDYLTVDPAHKLLYVPRSTHTMVLDARTGKTVADIPGQKRNHGAAIVPDANRGFITDGEDGSVTVFDLKTYATLGKVKAAEDADGVIYD